MKTHLQTHLTIATASRAVLALAEIKAATAAFDRGETNVFDALDAVETALELLRAAGRRGRRAKPDVGKPPAAA